MCILTFNLGFIMSFPREVFYVASALLTLFVYTLCFTILSLQLIGRIETRTVKVDKSHLRAMSWTVTALDAIDFRRASALPKNRDRAIEQHSFIWSTDFWRPYWILKVFLRRMNFFLFTVVVLIAIQGGEWTCICNAWSLCYGDFLKLPRSL